MDEASINTLGCAERDMEVSSHLIHSQFAVDVAALSLMSGELRVVNNLFYNTRSDLLMTCVQT